MTEHQRPDQKLPLPPTEGSLSSPGGVPKGWSPDNRSGVASCRRNYLEAILAVVRRAR